MRKTLLATAAALSLLVATPTANAQFAVIDPANLVQNVQQVFQANRGRDTHSSTDRAGRADRDRY